MSTIDLNINFTQQPQDGDKFQYQFLQNGTPISFNNGDITAKTFRDLIPTTIDRSGIFNVEGKLQNIQGKFNSEVKVVLRLNRGFGKPNYIVYGGTFTQYEQPNGSLITCHNFLITDINGFALYYNTSTPIPSTQLYPNPSINAFEYDPVSDTLYIGGIWEFWDEQDNFGDTLLTSWKIPSFIPFDLDSLEIGVDANYFITKPKIEGEIKTLKRNGNTLYIGGNYKLDYTIPGTSTLSTTRHLSALRLNLIATNTITVQWVDNFSNTLRVEPNGIVNTLEIIDNNTMIAGGDFDWFGIRTSNNNVILSNNTNNIARFNVNGSGITSLNGEVNGAVEKIINYSGNLYIGGDFQLYTYIPSVNLLGGTSVVCRRFIRTNLNGNINHLHNSRILNNQFFIDFFPKDILSFNNFQGSEGIIVVGDGLNTSPGENHCFIFRPNGLLTTIIPLNGNVNSITRGGSFITFIIAGDFTVNDPGESPLLTTDDIEIKSTLNETKLQTFNNLQLNNFNNNIQYINELTRIKVVLDSAQEDLLDVLNIEDADPRVTIDFQIDQIIPDLTDELNLAYKRSDYIVTSFGGNQTDWENVRFDYKLYDGNINNNLLPQPEFKSINKIRLNDIQDKQYLNMMPLINLGELNPTNFLSLSANGVYNSTTEGKWLYTQAVNKINGTNLNVKEDIAYVTRGWRDNREDLSLPQDFKLIEGDSRVVTRGKSVKLAVMPLYISRITVFSGNDVLEDITLGSVNQYKNSDSYFSYFVFNTNPSINKFRIVLGYRNSIPNKTINYTVVDGNCDYDSTEVLFINRFGILENTFMNGRLQQNISTKSDKYNRSIRDINGNLTSVRHSNVSYNKNADEELIANTGLVKEYNNDLYTDLIMSDRVWVVVNNKVIPATIETTTYNPQSRIVDRTINYEFTFRLDNNKAKNLI